MLVVGIDKDKTVLATAQEIVKFAFCFNHTFERAEALQVGTTNVGNQSASRFSGLSQRLDVAWVTGTHLNHGYFVLLVQTEQRLGYTYIIVKVTLGVEHIVFL